MSYTPPRPPNGGPYTYSEWEPYGLKTLACVFVPLALLAVAQFVYFAAVR